jgi:hypothetical protein
MLKRVLTTKLLFSLLSLGVPAQVHAQTSVGFICSNDLGTPATVVVSSGKERPFIRWTSDRFAGSGWSAERRCEAVSQRLQESYDKGSLKFLTPGRMNGLPVVCSTDRDGGSCIDLIYTLKPGQNPATTLSNLLQARQGTSGPISESSRRAYFSVDALIKR